MKQSKYITPCLMEHKSQLRMSILTGSIVGNGAFNGSKEGDADPVPSMPFDARNKSVD
ncbi:MAG: hypothetical protein J5663_07000 [Bacteroidaceae bacterium]|nr:hypothetical protein [Bacteroidaceae bacterium]